MTTFLTLTLHPAVDRIVEVERLIPGALLDGRLLKRVPAGKGVNTARVLRRVLGPRAKVLAAAWLGTNEVSLAARSLAAEGIELAVARRSCPTRICTTYLERLGGRETHVKESMPAPSRTECSELLHMAARLPVELGCAAVCGSAPPQTPARTLRAVLAALRAHARVLLADTNGPLLEWASKSGLDGIKGNAQEIGALLKLRGPLDPSKRAHAQALRALPARRGGPKAVLVTASSDAAWLATREGLWRAKPPVLPTSRRRSATGCGDAATAGWMWAWSQGLEPDEALRLAVACGSAKFASADPGAVEVRLARRLSAQIEVRREQ
ncbi:MAG: 1-phosphofructokinase [Planctomycetota bacterium]